MRAGGSRALVLGTALALVTAGGFGLLALQPAADATRFGRVTEAAAIVGAVGVAAALGSLALPALGVVATVTALLVLAAPTLAGHALDPHRLRGLVALADFVHVLAAAVWIGGLVLLVLVRSPRAGRRFRAVAAGSVAVLGAAAIPRALAAFPSLSSVVDTSYGRAVLVKTGLLVVVLVLGWSNRQRLARVGFLGELVVLAGIVGTVAVLTDLRPPARSGAAVAAPAPPHAPPRDALVLAQQDDDVGIALAASPRGRNIAAQVTALGPEGKGVDDLDVQIGGASTRRCGPGCYAATIPLPATPRRVPVRVGGRTLVFRLPARWPAPAAGALVDRVDRVFRAPPHRRHPRAPCVFGEERDHDHLPRPGAEPLLLPDRERPRGGRDRQDALGSPPARTLAALRAGPDQAARALLGIRPDAECPPARGEPSVLLRPEAAGLVRADRRPEDGAPPGVADDRRGPLHAPPLQRFQRAAEDRSASDHATQP